MSTQMSSSTRRHGTGRSTSGWRGLSPAVVAVVATAVAVETGRSMFGWIFAFAAIMSLYGSIDHLVTPAVAEAAGRSGPALTVPGALPPAVATPAVLTARQRRVLRFLAFGLPEDEIAELLQVDEATVGSDVDEIVAVLGVARSQVIEAARHDLLGTAAPTASRAA